MNSPILVLCLLDLAFIAALPRIFFRPGRLNVRWWATAAPFFVSALVLLGGVAGVFSPAIRATGAGPVLLESLAAGLAAASIALIGYTLGSHHGPVSLWHQEDDCPARLVTHGAYARVRHPFYLAFLLALLGCVAAFPHLATVGAFLFASVQLHRTAVREERRLLASPLGPAYDRYRRRSGRLLPRFRPAEELMLGGVDPVTSRVDGK